MSKLFALTALALAHAANAQRFATSCAAEEPCTSVSAASSCQEYKQVSLNGRRCATGAKALGSGVTQNECSLLASGDADCSSLFTYVPQSLESNSTCTCQLTSAGDCDVVREAHSNVALYETTPNSVFCVCDAESLSYDANCSSVASENIASTFVQQLNVVDEMANNGALWARVAAESANEEGVGVLNDLTLFHAGDLLHRGVDAEVTLRLAVYPEAFGLTSDTVSNSSEYDAWYLEVHNSDLESALVGAVVSGIITEANDNGNTLLPSNILVLSSPEVDAVPCVCTAVSSSDYSCNQTCVSLDLNLILLEVRQFEQYELALIIAACVVFVCVLAIAFSFVKSKEIKFELHKSPTPDAEEGRAGAF